MAEDAASSLQTQGTLQLYQPTLDIHTPNLFDITKLDKPGTYIPDYSWNKIDELSSHYRQHTTPLDFKEYIKQIRTSAGRNAKIDTHIPHFATELEQNLTNTQKHDLKFLSLMQHRQFLNKQSQSKIHHITTALQYIPQTLSDEDKQTLQKQLLAALQHTTQTQVLLSNITLAELEFKK